MNEQNRNPTESGDTPEQLEPTSARPAESHTWPGGWDFDELPSAEALDFLRELGMC